MDAKNVISSVYSGKALVYAKAVVAGCKLGIVKEGMSVAAVAAAVRKAGLNDGIEGNKVYRLKERWSDLQEKLDWLPDIFNSRGEDTNSSAVDEILSRAMDSRLAEPPLHESALESAVREETAKKPAKK